MLDVRPQRNGQSPEVVSAGHLIESLLSISDLCCILGINRRTFERMRSAGRVPNPDLIVGCRSPRWLPSTIRRWCEGGQA
jgi:predicted DNA-binding transcriptional regulator AlpA